MEFDAHQRKIIDLTNGKHLILAPPGSGKTEILSHRIKNALKNGIPPSNIACLTFTNRAARNMRDRLPEGAENIFVGNFHAWSIEYLKKIDIFSSGHSLLDEEDTEVLLESAVQNALKKINIKYLSNDTLAFIKKYSKLCNNLRKQIDLKLNEQIIIKTKKLLIYRYSEFMSFYSPSLNKKDLYLILPIIYQNYERLKKENYCFDFDDLLNLSLFYLNKKNNATNNLKLYAWLQVDEVQDLNHVQWSLIKSFTNNTSHIIALGDIDQSIFSFMGSSFETLREETQNYSQHSLVVNYRSPKYLLNLFKDYAKINFKKNLNIISNDKNDRTWNNCQIILCENEEIQVNILKEKIFENFNNIKNKKKCTEKIAILFRKNEDARELSGILEEMNIGHFLVSDHDIFRKRNSKDFMSILSILKDPHSKLAWQRLFYTFSNMHTLTESREIVNDLFYSGINPADVLHSYESNYQGNLLNFCKTVETNRCIVFDTETTGTNTDSCDIIQIAAVELVNGRPCQEFEVYLKTSQEIGTSFDVHHISKKTLNFKGVNRKEGLNQFKSFIKDSTLIAHNLNFDWNILQNNFERELGCNLKISHSRYCTLQMSRNLWPNQNNHKLETLLKLHKIQGKNTHNALDDVRATCNLVEKIIEIFQKKFYEYSIVYSRHEDILKSFKDSFQPIWEELNTYINKKTSFRNIFEIFFDRLHLYKPIYSMEKIREVESKIIRHMDRYCNDDKLRNLLDNYLSKYQVYKEPDLVLEEDQIVLSTIHRSKGLEFDIVYIPSCRDGVYPLHWIKQNDELAEEARILYVALTRSKKQLFLLRPNVFETRNGPKKSYESRWIKPLKVHFQ